MNITIWHHFLSSTKRENSKLYFLEGSDRCHRPYQTEENKHLNRYSSKNEVLTSDGIDWTGLSQRKYFNTSVTPPFKTLQENSKKC